MRLFGTWEPENFVTFLPVPCETCHDPTMDVAEPQKQFFASRDRVRTWYKASDIGGLLTVDMLLIREAEHLRLKRVDENYKQLVDENYEQRVEAKTTGMTWASQPKD